MDKKLTITRRTVAIASLLTIWVTILILAVVSFSIKHLPDDKSFDESFSQTILDTQQESVYEVTESYFDASVTDDEYLNSNVFFDSDNISNVIQDGTTDGEDDTFEHGWIINEYGYTYVYQGCGYEQFNYKTSALNRYINSINAFSESISDDVRLFNILVPVSSTFADIPREIYTVDSFFNQSQSSFVATVSSQNNERIIDVSIVSQLEEQYDNGEAVFLKTDKNWTSLGAYTAYRTFSESAGVEYFSLNDFQTIDLGEYLGSFYQATKLESMKQSPDQFVCVSTLPTVKTALTVFDIGRIYTDYKLCDNNVGVDNAYNVFFGRIASRYEVSTNVDAGALLIIGDSSSYAMVPYLASHYGIIDIIDPRNTDTSLEQIMSKREYDDCILMCYTTNAVNGEYIPLLNKFIGVDNG